MIYLPDVNVWISLTSNRHTHHQTATTWLHGIENDLIAFCRVTELGFLRLLTNPHVMGSDVLQPGQAWGVYDEWRADGRVIFLSEQTTFSALWRQMANHLSGGPNVWTDAYLSAFAAHCDATIITFDRAFPSLGKAAIVPLVEPKRGD
jgi:toxin-antitoxin system PIN domain toxin